MKKTILLLCVLFALIDNTNGQTTYDVFTYTEPANFVKDASSPGAVTYAHQTDSTFCVIGLYQNVPTKGTIQKDFDVAWESTLGTMKLSATAQKQPVQNADGWKMLTGYASIQFEGVPCIFYLNTISGNGIAANVMYLTNSDSYSKVLEVFQANLDVNKPAIKNPVASQPISPSSNNTSSFTLLNGSGITGVWVSYNKPDITQNLQWNWFIFFNNGKSLQNLPNGGFYNLSNGTYYDVSKNKPEYWPVGSYSFSNGNGKNKKREEVNYQETLKLIKSNQLSINGAAYFKCITVNGQKLNGAFTSYANPNDPQLQTLSYGAKPVLTFYANGKFKDEGLFNTYLFDGATNPEAAKPGNGTYELKDYSIILKYDDGRVRQEAFTIPFSNTTTDATIIFISRAQVNKIK